MEDCKFPLFIPYLDSERKSKRVHSGIKQGIWKHTAESKIVFSPFFSNGRLLEAGILPRIVNKITIFSIQIGDGRLLEHGRLIEILRYFVFAC